MNKIPVLAYHGLINEVVDGDRNKYNIPIETFIQQMRLLNELNYRTVTLNDTIGRHHDALDTPRIMITFDDGHESNFIHALPILEKYRFKAIFFITTGLIGQQKGFMNWQQITELNNKGQEIQSHGHTHNFLNRLNLADIKYELEQSRDLIYGTLNKNPISFSCPGGRFNKRVVEIAKELGYKNMFISKPGYLKIKNGFNPFLVNRWMITSSIKNDEFIQILKKDIFFLGKEGLEYLLKNVLKKLIGDNRYQHFLNVKNNEEQF